MKTCNHKIERVKLKTKYAEKTVTTILMEFVEAKMHHETNMKIKIFIFL